MYVALYSHFFIGRVHGIKKLVICFLAIKKMNQKKTERNWLCVFLELRECMQFHAKEEENMYFGCYLLFVMDEVYGVFVVIID
jgi:hypothetical protein